MDWVKWVTFGIAVVGATLGVFNAWWTIRRETVRLKVNFVSFYLPGTDTWTTGIEVTNTGYLAVTITEVGAKRGRFAKKRGVLVEDYFGRVRLPHRLEPRTCITVAASPGRENDFGRLGFTHCHAATACGITVRSRIKTARV